MSYNIHEMLLSCGIPGLKKVGDKWNARCVVCGDSKKSSKKKRFWILPSRRNPGSYKCYCFNCPYRNSLKYFLKTYYEDVYKEYFKAKFKTRRKLSKFVQTKHKEKEKKKDTSLDKSSIGLSKLISLDDNHIANKYVDSRLIPKMWKKYLMYTDNYKIWVNEKIPNKFEKISDKDQRLVIPFYTKEGKLFGVAGRALDKKGFPRYITIRFDDDHPKIFGLERVDFSKPVYVFEGQLDSLFIPNSLAMGGSISNVNKLLGYAPKERFVLVPDLEPRNVDVCNFIKKSIDNGFSVSLLPTELKKYGKDINAIIEKSDFTRKDVYDMIVENTMCGIQSRIKFLLWKKVK